MPQAGNGGVALTRRELLLVWRITEKLLQRRKQRKIKQKHKRRKSLRCDRTTSLKEYLKTKKKERKWRRIFIYGTADG